MPLDKPYYLTYRPMIDGPNAGYSRWAYIRDPYYARSPGHYVRAYLLIQKDLERLFEYVEPSPEAELTFSFRIHELLMRTCIEVEANFKAILDANIYTPAINRFQQPIYNMSVYKKVNASHHLSSYEVMLPLWNGPRKILKPFEGWNTGKGIDWYQAYNASKHDRLQEFKQANMGALISAVSGLLVLISSQFQDQDFSAGDDLISLGGMDYHDMSASTGSLFRIAYPNDWPDGQKYDFDWAKLRGDPDRFQRFNYDRLP
ncbi:MAG: hypothetical protein ABS40_05850 [Agrobacterium sp. SCN 61-19]|nr:MAG: hypothetical protein ABS40_05850 [Agrobacterium sp. SCN 61-19]